LTNFLHFKLEKKRHASGGFVGASSSMPLPLRRIHHHREKKRTEKSVSVSTRHYYYCCEDFR
jgi:hypothetical protein